MSRVILGSLLSEFGALCEGVRSLEILTEDRIVVEVGTEHDGHINWSTRTGEILVGDGSGLDVDDVATHI